MVDRFHGYEHVQLRDMAACQNEQTLLRDVLRAPRQSLNTRSRHRRNGSYQPGLQTRIHSRHFRPIWLANEAIATQRPRRVNEAMPLRESRNLA